LNSDELQHLPAGAAESLDALLVFNLLRSHNYVAPYIDRGLRGLNLTCAQLNFLLLLSATKKQGLPLSEVGRRLVVSKANITGLANRLELRGFVRRGKADDRRVIAAKLTKEGGRLVSGIFPAHEKLFSEMVDCLNTNEKRQLIRLLTKLRKGLRKKRRIEEQGLRQQ
jgi:MarR family transcriptional regulator, 2-MHQ and catechol-resistance regulon repressor